MHLGRRCSFLDNVDSGTDRNFVYVETKTIAWRSPQLSTWEKRAHCEISPISADNSSLKLRSTVLEMLSGRPVIHHNLEFPFFFTFIDQSMSSQTRHVKRREPYTTFLAFSVLCECVIERLRGNVQLRDHKAKLPIFIFSLFFSLLS